MATPLRIKRSAVQGKVPTIADLQLGELGINTYDGLLFFKKDDGTESIVTLDPAGSAEIADINGLQGELDEKWSDSNNTLPSYKMPTLTTTSNLNFAANNIFKVNANVNRTLTFSNIAGAGLNQTIAVFITGSSGSITWPSSTEWDGDTAPELGASWTIVVLFTDGTTVYGKVGGKA